MQLISDPLGTLALTISETSICDFFDGRISAKALDELWRDAFEVQQNSDRSRIRRLASLPPGQPYQVAPHHILLLIGACQRGELSIQALDALCFAIEASDPFEWDTDTSEGERVARALFWLGTPEINYPLTPPVLDKIKHYVLTGDNTLTSTDTK